MVQFLIKKDDQEGFACGVCKSYSAGFCYKWSFPIREFHVPCTKFRPLEKVQEVIEPDTNGLIPKKLIVEFLKKLKNFRNEIIGKPFDEIYINFDKLIDDYKKKFGIET